MRKRGGELETSLHSIHELYLMERRARIHKVDPPTRVFQKGGRKQVIFLENPFLDYIGVWTEAGGRMLAVEAKETAEPRLELAKTKLNPNQCRAIDLWTGAGAVAVICWRHDRQIKLVTPEIIRAEQEAGRASVRWSRACPLYRPKHPADYLGTLLVLGLDKRNVLVA